MNKRFRQDLEEARRRAATVEASAQAERAAAKAEAAELASQVARQQVAQDELAMIAQTVASVARRSPGLQPRPLSVTEADDRPFSKLRYWWTPTPEAHRQVRREYDGWLVASHFFEYLDMGGESRSLYLLCDGSLVLDGDRRYAERYSGFWTAERQRAALADFCVRHGLEVEPAATPGLND